MPIVLATLVADFRYPDNFDEWIAQANIGIQEIAAKYRCRVAYVHEALGHDRKHYNDAVHPNDAGARLMGRAVHRAFTAAAMAPGAFDLKFDTVDEARIQNYVFIPDWETGKEGMIAIFGVTKSGLTVKSGVPLKVRTPTLYQKLTMYEITIRDQNGKKLSRREVKSSWLGMIQFTVDPEAAAGPLSVEIGAKD
jgi:hypothetical protein